MTNAQHSSHGPSSVQRVAMRYGLFTVLVFALILLIWWLAQSRKEELFSEGSPLEWIQFGLLVATALVFCRRLRSGASSPLAAALTALPAMAAIRELDKYFDQWLPLFGWQLPFYLILITAGWLLWKQRDIFRCELPAFVSHRAFGILWAGFIIAIPFAQMIGHGQFLMALFDEEYHRSVKRVIEECAETVGYLILLFGAIDWTLSSMPADDGSA